MPDVPTAEFQYTQRLLYPVKCAIDGISWDRRTQPTPPCGGHTEAEWSAHFAGQPNSTGQRWIPDQSNPDTPGPLPPDPPIGPAVAVEKAYDRDRPIGPPRR